MTEKEKLNIEMIEEHLRSVEGDLQVAMINDPENGELEPMRDQWRAMFGAAEYTNLKERKEELEQMSDQAVRERWDGGGVNSGLPRTRVSRRYFFFAKYIMLHIIFHHKTSCAQIRRPFGPTKRRGCDVCEKTLESSKTLPELCQKQL